MRVKSRLFIVFSFALALLTLVGIGIVLSSSKQAYASGGGGSDGRMDCCADCTNKPPGTQVTGRWGVINTQGICQVVDPDALPCVKTCP